MSVINLLLFVVAMYGSACTSAYFAYLYLWYPAVHPFERTLYAFLSMIMVYAMAYETVCLIEHEVGMATEPRRKQE